MGNNIVMGNLRTKIVEVRHNIIPNTSVNVINSYTNLIYY